MQKKVRILVADDHTVLRQGLTQLLSQEPDFEIVGEAANGVEAIDLAEKLQPDVILMDLGMPVMDGIEATRIIHQASPKIRIIWLSMYLKQDVGKDIVNAGAVGFVSKSEPKKQLLKVIRSSLKNF